MTHPDPDEEKKAEPTSPDESKSAEEKPVEELTPEEQMAKYEESLKEDDWGHQPC